MSLRRAGKLFQEYGPFVQFARSLAHPPAVPLDNRRLRDRALELAEDIEPRSDRSDLIEALGHLGIDYDKAAYGHVSSMLHFLAQTLFRDISRSVPLPIRRSIFEFRGPKFFFVWHASYYDYMLVGHVLQKMGIRQPVFHVAGSVTEGWLSNWLEGMRTLKIPKTFTAIEHRAYSWLTAALAESHTPQVLFARTSRYWVRARDGILREPYVPHGIVASVKAAGRALVVPVAVSYAAIPEDRYLASSTLFPMLSVLPKRASYFLPYYLGIKKPDKMFRGMENVFGDVSVDLGEPFELADDDSLSLQRITHRAMEGIARNKLIHPSHLVAKAMQVLQGPTVRELREQVEREVDRKREFFASRYHKEPPFHGLIVSDLPEAIQRGVKVLSSRGGLSRSLLRKRYFARDESLLRFYSYLGDRRIYPLSGRNTMTVVNAGAWGYTLALHIGRNLLRRDDLAEHSIILHDSREDLIERLTVEGRHPWFYKDIPLPRSVRPEADLVAAIRDTSLILVVTPSKYFYSAITRIADLAADGTDLVIATKGFIPETGLLPSQTVQEIMERSGKHFRLSILAGANLAHEIMEGGAGVTQLSCEDYSTFERLRTLIETPLFRVVYSDDIVGACISAALKNIYAIGFGILEGSKLAPENFLAAYATLATAEIRQFGLLLGANPETFDAESQAWMADLLATCRGGRSARFGRDLAAMDEKHGKLQPARTLLEQYRKKKLAIEGFEAARYAQRMAAQRGFHPPILGEIYSILHGGKKVHVHEFVEKCLDALSKRKERMITSSIRQRSQRK